MTKRNRYDPAIIDALLAQFPKDDSKERLRAEAADLGHVVKRRKLETNRHANRWDCTCGLYGITNDPAATRDRALDHLRSVVIDAKLQ